jgi:putative phosphoribosyl transferase
LVDDGLATGATMRAAVLSLYSKEPGRLIVAVPVAAEESCHAFRDLVDAIVCLVTPEPFDSVGRWYASYPSVSDEEVGLMLAAQAVVPRPA